MTKQKLSRILFIPLVVAIVAVIDVGFRAFFTEAFSHIPQGSNIDRYFIFQTNRAQSDILIVGASGASRHYDPRIIAQATGRTVVNAGCDGQGINYQYLSLLNALRNGPVSLVVLDMSDMMLQAQGLDDISSYYPFYWQNDSLADYARQKLGPLRAATLVSAMVQYNGQLTNAIKCYRPAHADYCQGYQALPPAATPAEPHHSTAPYLPEPQGMTYMERFVDVCRAHHIPLIISIHPQLDPQESFVGLIERFCADHDVTLWNMIDPTTLGIPQAHFVDYSHMDVRGAEAYSRLVGQRLADLALWGNAPLQ